MGTEAKKVHLKDFELAERWGLDVEDVRDMVRTRHIPYVWVGKGDRPNLDRVSWRYVRFRIAAIERWEDEQERTMTERPPAPALSGGDEGADLLRGGWQDEARAKVATKADAKP